jgi:DNA-binding CsgD family transcriptional regulator
MQLIERAGFLASLQSKFKDVGKHEGHSVLVVGEAGIGKTSLVRAFCKDHEAECKIYIGSCDALFTPRPLAPLYDIVWQMRGDTWENRLDLIDRSELFTSFLHEFEHREQTTIIVFEDIHWADEATLDFIKFFTRRITQIHCLFILTYRDTEIHAHHPLRNVLGQMPPASFTRLQLVPLSREAVEKRAAEKGWSGEDVYRISGGNPFYVNEILASYSLGVPDNIKDSILSIYNQMDEKAKHIWQILSVLPSAFEISYLEKMEPSFEAAIERYLDLKILILDKGLIFFKHELYRRTIEASLSPFIRISLNKKILELFRENFETNHEIERIVHHAKNANETEIVVHYAPQAARQAAQLGAHIEASKLHLSAIEYYQGKDKDLLIQFYEAYAYECYLTRQVKEAIIYTGKSLTLWKEKKDIEKTGNCLRFLSRLNWLDGNRKNAEIFARQAVESLGNELPSKTKAMAFSNMSQLKILLDKPGESLLWGEKAIMVAQELGDEEALSHALNNVGSVKMHTPSLKNEGIECLQQSLKIALKNSYHEHVARAYSNMGSNGLSLKNFEFTKKILDEGIQYCEERDLDLWRLNMLSLKANLYVETGDWKQAYNIADNLLKNEILSPSFTICALNMMATIIMRTGDGDALPLLLKAYTMAFETGELQRIMPTLIASLEYEWLTGNIVIKTEDLDRITSGIEQSMYFIQKNEFAFWLLKTRKQHLSFKESYKGYDLDNLTKVQEAAIVWKKIGYPYAQALALFEGNNDNKRQAISIVQKLGANVVNQKMKLEMRLSGIKNIPKGIRKTTQSNSANLTERELDVLRLLKEGMRNKEIGARLFVSTKTVEHHISSIFFKLDANSRSKAVKQAVHLDIIK